ncbi:MAG: 4-hydroxybenzoate octaprenyltransferase [Pseudomonadota bacterium]
MSESPKPAPSAPEPNEAPAAKDVGAGAVDAASETDAIPARNSGDWMTPSDGHLPQWMRDNLPDWTEPYIYLSRWDRPVGIWLLVLPCWIGFGFTAISAGFGPATVLWAGLFFIGAIAMRGAGCTWNDIADRKLDAEVDRTAGRPLASGRVSVPQASLWLGLQLGVALLIWFMLPLDAKIVALIALPLVGAYPFMKRYTWWPQAWLGATFNFGVLIAAATTASISLTTIILWLGLACWTVAYDTIYALQDKEDDELAGIKSTARLFGDQAVMGAFIFHLIAASLIALAAFFAGAPQIGAVTSLAFLGHGIWQASRMARDGDEAALTVFRSNVWAGGLLAAGFLVAGMV